MRIRASLRVLVAAAAAAGALPCASALAGPADLASTSTYIQANYTLVQQARAHLAAAEAAPLRVLAQVRRECPAAAAESPQDGDSTQLSNEVIGAMVLRAYHLDLPALERFIAVAAHLRWSNARLTSAVHGYATDLAVLARLAPPSLCADVRAWVSSGYRTLPASTVSFDKRFMAAWVGIGRLPGKLAAYESPQQRSLLRRTSALELDLADGEARAVESWGKIMLELGLSP